MPGYFGNEPTCHRCDYPRRLHHLLRVGHDYELRQKEALGAGATASEGEETTNQQEGDSVTQNTAPASYVDPVDDGYLEVLATVEVGDRLQLVFERYVGNTTDGDELPPELSVSFVGPIGCLDEPEVPVERIPDLIDALTELHRTWLHAGGAA